MGAGVSWGPNADLAMFAGAKSTLLDPGMRHEPLM